MTATHNALTRLFREHAPIWNHDGLFCTGCPTPFATPETTDDPGPVMRRFADYAAYAQHLAELISPELAAPALPAPTGWRGSGMPAWDIERTHNSRYSRTKPDPGYITPVPSYNRSSQFTDETVPTLDLEIPEGEWTIPDARRLALAILAASYWKET